MRLFDRQMVRFGFGLVFGAQESEGSSWKGLLTLSFFQMAWSWWILSISRRGEVRWWSPPPACEGASYSLPASSPGPP